VPYQNSIPGRIGRPRIPDDLRELILAMARDNPSWGQARIANELLVKLGMHVSPRTIQKYLRKDPNGGRKRPDPSQMHVRCCQDLSLVVMLCADKLFRKLQLMMIVNQCDCPNNDLI
jgi:hypothetical protein